MSEDDKQKLYDLLTEWMETQEESPLSHGRRRVRRPGRCGVSAAFWIAAVVFVACGAMSPADDGWTIATVVLGTIVGYLARGTKQ